MSIVKLDKKNFEDMVQVDKEADHPIDSQINLDYSEILEERFEDGGEEFFGYLDNGELKGYISLTRSSNNQCRIYWLNVKGKFQGNGIGTELVRFIEKYAKEEGLDKILVCTNKLMDRARKFYENLGFEFLFHSIGHYKYPNSRYNTAVFYSKALKSLDF